MIYILIVFLILILLFIKIYINIKQKEIEEFIDNKEYNDECKCLPDNISLCKEILKILKNEKTKVKLSEDKKSDTSVYNIISDEIILCNNEKVSQSFMRVLLISHECWHSMQNKKIMKFNFEFAIVNVIIALVAIGLICFNVINISLYNIIFAIILLLNIFSFFSRNIIESEATFMAYRIAGQYLKSKMLGEYTKIIEQYYIITLKGYSTFMFSIFLKKMLIPLIVLVIMLVKSIIIVYI